MTFRPDAISRGLLVVIFLLLVALTVKEYARNESVNKFDFSNHDQKFATEILASDSAVTEKADSLSSTETTDISTEKHKKSRKNNKNNKLTILQKIININTAGIDDLATLPGVGPKMAEKIVEHRKINGNFLAIEDIRLIKGIGDKKFEKMKPWIKI